jgi:hypothetical protein
MKTDPKASHYDKGGIPTIQFIKAKLSPLEFRGFCRGNILKYAARMGEKGDPDRDLEKIGFYQRFMEGESKDG